MQHNLLAIFVMSFLPICKDTLVDKKSPLHLVFKDVVDMPIERNFIFVNPEKKKDIEQKKYRRLRKMNKF